MLYDFFHPSFFHQLMGTIQLDIDIDMMNHFVKSLDRDMTNICLVEHLFTKGAFGSCRSNEKGIKKGITRKGMGKPCIPSSIRFCSRKKMLYPLIPFVTIQF